MQDNKNLLWKYAGLGAQFLIAIGAAVYIGINADKWLHFKSPIFVWVLPLLFIVVIMYKIIKDTSPKNKS
jgi:hypothetical protein